MSEPITRAEFRDFLIHKERVDLLHPGTSPALIFDSWCEQHRTESASPPRVPGASAQNVTVGVQSGPGQPIDLAAQLENDASAWEEAALAADEYDHAPEGMRETAALEREAAAEIRRLRAESESRYRTGIEAAVEAAAALRGSREPPNWNDAINEAMRAIRALAGKPPADTLLPGLEYIAKKIDEHRYVFRSEVSAAEAHKAAGIEYSTLVHREIAARKGG